MADEHDARRIGLSLPGTGENGFDVGGKGYAWVYQQKVAGVRGRVERRDVLAVRVATLDEKDALLAADPDKFFTDAHYAGFPAVLVRLAAIDSSELTELLTDAWRTRAPKKLLREFDAEKSSCPTQTTKSADGNF